MVAVVSSPRPLHRIKVTRRLPAQKDSRLASLASWKTNIFETYSVIKSRDIGIGTTRLIFTVIDTSSFTRISQRPIPAEPTKAGLVLSYFLYLPHTGVPNPT